MNKILEGAFCVTGGGRFEGPSKNSTGIDCPNAAEIETAPDVSDAIEIIGKTVLDNNISVTIFRDKETKKEYVLAQRGDNIAMIPRQN